MPFFSDNPEGASAAGKKSKRGKSWSTLFKELMTQEIPAGWEKDTILSSGYKMPDNDLQNLIAARLIAKAALDGDLKAVEMVMDRVDGKPKQSIETTEAPQSFEGIPKDKRDQINQLLFEEDTNE